MRTPARAETQLGPAIDNDVVALWRGGGECSLIISSDRLRLSSDPLRISSDRLRPSLDPLRTSSDPLRPS
jgi:hypothetical protein